MGVSPYGRPTALDMAAVVIVSISGYLIYGLVGAAFAGLLMLAVFVAVEYLVIIPAGKVKAIEDDIMNESPNDQNDSG